MHRRGFVLGAVTALVLTGATLAQAAVSRHRVSQTIELVTVSQSANYPNPGSSATDAGLVSGTLGRGAISQTSRITGHPNPTTYTFRTSSTAFYSHGSLVTAITGTAIVQTNGTLKLAGHGRWIRGTDAYRGAHGSFTLAGTIPLANPSKPTPAVVHTSGTVSF